MLRGIISFALGLVAFTSFAAEMYFDFSETAINESPEGFRSAVSGSGQPGRWIVIEAEVPRSFKTITLNVPQANLQHVLAQLSEDLTDDHYPMLIYEELEFSDFTLTTRFKTVRGIVDRMAGIAFRIQDENNYYYVRASSLGNTFRFFKVVNGQLSEPIGVDVEIPSDRWHDLKIRCESNRMWFELNGKEIMPMLTDNTFLKGKIGFWTKSDSVSYFATTKIDYTPQVLFAQKLVNQLMDRYPRILGLRIYGRKQPDESLKLIATHPEGELGLPATDAINDVVERANVYYAKQKGKFTVTLPIKDRNGDPVAAAAIELESFAGQTQNNALARCLPISTYLDSNVLYARELFE